MDLPFRVAGIERGGYEIRLAQRVLALGEAGAAAGGQQVAVVPGGPLLSDSIGICPCQQQPDRFGTDPGGSRLDPAESSYLTGRLLHTGASSGIGPGRLRRLPSPPPVRP